MPLFLVKIYQMMDVMGVIKQLIGVPQTKFDYLRGSTTFLRRSKGFRIEKKFEKHPIPLVTLEATFL
jgi:hypothetical protein